MVLAVGRRRGIAFVRRERRPTSRGDTALCGGPLVRNAARRVDAVVILFIDGLIKIAVLHGNLRVKHKRVSQHTAPGLRQARLTQLEGRHCRHNLLVVLRRLLRTTGCKGRVARSERRERRHTETRNGHRRGLVHDHRSNRRHHRLGFFEERLAQLAAQVDILAILPVLAEALQVQAADTADRHFQPTILHVGAVDHELLHKALRVGQRGAVHHTRLTVRKRDGQFRGSRHVLLQKGVALLTLRARVPTTNAAGNHRCLLRTNFGHKLQVRMHLKAIAVRMAATLLE
mmetsp:Transcript_32264/g.55769  ORF Transcript_32264/g.55769 Transcript_32264/m.55769 type:complete len:287 (+) Transcript_32264:373-1233(+)